MIYGAEYEESQDEGELITSCYMCGEKIKVKDCYPYRDKKLHRDIILCKKDYKKLTEK